MRPEPVVLEIERKFLVRGEGWRPEATASRLRQGYVTRDSRVSVRVRLEDGRGTLTVKGPRRGASRIEVEVPVPLAEAEQLLDELCGRPLIEKTRYRVRHGLHTWEVDVFEGDNAGLVLAEIELSAPDESFERPEWVGREVTDDPRFYNANLAETPYCLWASQAPQAD